MQGVPLQMYSCLNNMDGAEWLQMHFFLYILIFWKYIGANSAENGRMENQ